jgi:MYXO-CTERM domain-containing protein
VAGCGVEDQYGVARSELNVSDYQTQGCSTAAVVGLSKQIADEMACISPGLLAKFEPSTRLQITSNAVLPYLHSTAKTDLLKVAETKTLQVNSAFRTVAQQYLLYRWYQLGRCSITAAATPGRSNHETGRALDLANYSSVISAMAARGWSHSVPGDPVHFDHLSSPDSRGLGVKAFQRLWNRNHPNDRIAEDGLYGPQTEARLKSSPATGFALGASCGARIAGADIVKVEGPDKVAPAAKARYSITVDNTGALDWPATTMLRVAGGGTSDLYDPATWLSESELGAIGTDIGAGARGVIDLEVQAPDVSEETPLFTQLELTDGTETFGTINLALTVAPNAAPDLSSDGDDANDDGIEVTGGCSTGGGAAGWGALALVGLLAMRRRRR